MALLAYSSSWYSNISSPIVILLVLRTCLPLENSLSFVAGSHSSSQTPAWSSCKPGSSGGPPSHQPRSASPPFRPCPASWPVCWRSSFCQNSFWHHPPPAAGQPPPQLPMPPPSGALLPAPSVPLSCGTLPWILGDRLMPPASPWIKSRGQSASEPLQDHICQELALVSCLHFFLQVALQVVDCGQQVAQVHGTVPMQVVQGHDQWGHHLGPLVQEGWLLSLFVCSPWAPQPLHRSGPNLVTKMSRE